MNFQTFTDHENSTYPICILAPKLETVGITKEYLEPSLIDPEDVIAYQLHTTGKKTKVVDQKAFLTELMQHIAAQLSKFVLVDSVEANQLIL